MSTVTATSTLSRITQQRRLMIGLILTALVVLFAVLGPWLAPYGENEVVGLPFSTKGVLGTDYLGQDILSRLMYGGRVILLIAILGTVIGMVLGVLFGVVAAYAGGWWDEIIMRLNDAVLAFPQILLALLVLTAVDQPAAWMIIVIIGISHAPRVARVARGVALGIVSRDYVQAAEALGEKRSRVVLAEVLPNMNAPLLAEAGLRLTYSIGLVAALGYLGFATDPSAANWGQMIKENATAVYTNPIGFLAPVFVIAVFTVGTNLMADGIAQLADRRVE